MGCTAEIPTDRRATFGAGRRRVVRVGAVAGIAAPAVFVGVVLLAGTSRPGLSMWASYVSELGESGSTTAGVVNASFVVVGILLGLFAAGLFAAGPLVALPRAAGGLVGLAALGFVVMAASPCSPGCPIAVVNVGATPADALHNLAAIAGLAGISLAAFQLGERAPDGFGRRGYRSFSAASGLAVAGLSATFGAAVLTGWRPAIGVAERVLLLATLLWVEVTALALLRARNGPPHRLDEER